MKIIATIEARMNSQRLPGKVLIDIGGYKSLECQIQRMRKSHYIDEIVIATTFNSSDNLIEEFAKQIGVAIYRGSEDDVMSRILGAAKSVNGDLQVQTTGDCPLIDARIIDQVIEYYLDNDGKYDFVSNEITRTFPIGLDCRVFPVAALSRAEKLCKDPIHRVHGSTFMYIGESKDLFISKNVAATGKLKEPDFRWTLDEKADLDFIRVVVKNFKSRVFDFSSSELVDWLIMNPDVMKINSLVRQKNFSES